MTPLSQASLVKLTSLEPQYTLGPVLGEGSSTVVRLATDRLSWSRFAAKVVPKDLLEVSSSLRKAVTNEILALSALKHHNIISYHGLRQDAKNVYVLLEYADGGDLLDYVVKRGALREGRAKSLFRQIVDALDYTHRNNYVHRDIKLENIFLDAKRRRIIMGDWGFSCPWSKHSTLHESCGSIHYAAPEIYLGRRYTGPEVDIWTLGILLFVMTTATLPFDSEENDILLLSKMIQRGEYQCPPSLSTTLKHLLSRLLTVDPSKRATLSEVRNHPWLLSSTRRKTLVPRFRLPLQTLQNDQAKNPKVRIAEHGVESGSDSDLDSSPERLHGSNGITSQSPTQQTCSKVEGEQPQTPLRSPPSWLKKSPRFLLAHDHPELVSECDCNCSTRKRSSTTPEVRVGVADPESPPSVGTQEEPDDTVRAAGDATATMNSKSDKSRKKRSSSTNGTSSIEQPAS